MNVPTLPKVSLQDGLTWENAQPERHEFHRREIFPMVGGRRVHGRAVGNLNRRLSEALDGSPSQVFAQPMKVQIGDDTMLNSDLFVTCDKADLATEVIRRARGRQRRRPHRVGRCLRRRRPAAGRGVRRRQRAGGGTRCAWWSCQVNIVF